jgi:hypothetical protein
MKVSLRPSADQEGSVSPIALSVSRVGSPPAGEIVKISPVEDLVKISPVE